MDQSAYGQSRIWLRSGVEEQHPPPHLPQHQALHPPLCLFSRGTFWPVWVCVLSVCVCVCFWVACSNGSGTSEDLFWKLDALQTFIRDLHWPEEEFAKHLESRIKLMSSNMIENCVKRCVFWRRLSPLRPPPTPQSWRWMLNWMLYCCIAAPGWHLSPSWQRAASRQISVFLQHYAPCSTSWWMPRTSLLNCAQWRWDKR